MTTVLVVDDEPDLEVLITRRFRQQIRDREMRLLFARNGVEALDTLARHPDVEVVLTDIRMPRMDGLTLIDKLQQTGHLLATVVVSAYGDMANIRTAMNRGAFDFLTKPIDFADLELTVARAARHAEGLRRARAQAAKLQQQREALLRAEKTEAFGKLLAGVSHELNNPLSILVINAFMLQEEAATAADPELSRKAGRIRLAAERCARIVRSFLAMAREQEVRRRAVGVAALIDGAMDMLADALRADGIEWQCDVPAGLPPVSGDADQLHQVLVNLVTNARHALHGAAGARRLRISAIAADGMVELLVADSGPGIPAGLAGRIFDPFFTTRPVGSGTGMGLAVSRGIVEAHGGSLDVAEDTGPGACFVVRLPQARAADPAPEQPDTLEEALISTDLRTALLVGGDAELAASIARALAVLGFRCDLAGTGLEAQGLLSRRDYGVILCDLGSADDGHEGMYRWLAQHRAHLCARVAFVTGGAMGPDSGSPRPGAGRPVLEKPFSLEELRRLVSDLVRRAR